jgi:hypothetical protein
MTPVKPPARQDKTSLWNYMRAFRRDILSAQPQRLYRAWMAEFRTPFFRSYMINQPDLIKTVLKTRPEGFSKIYAHRRRIAASAWGQCVFNKWRTVARAASHH